jgi:hypothetical protein
LIYRARGWGGRKRGKLLICQKKSARCWKSGTQRNISGAVMFRVGKYTRLEPFGFYGLPALICRRIQLVEIFSYHVLYRPIAARTYRLTYQDPISPPWTFRRSNQWSY